MFCGFEVSIGGAEIALNCAAVLPISGVLTQTTVTMGHFFFIILVPLTTNIHLLDINNFAAACACLPLYWQLGLCIFIIFVSFHHNIIGSLVAMPYINAAGLVF